MRVLAVSTSVSFPRIARGRGGRAPLADYAGAVLTFLEALKRILVGRPEMSGRLRPTPLKRGRALPVLSTNALSSLAYAPDEILLTLALGGVGAITLAPWVGVAVMVVLLVLVACYRIAVRAYPSGKGDYEIASKNLGAKAGVVVGAALMVDLTLTVAVSMSAAAHYLAAAFPALVGHEGLVAGAGVLILMVLNLRGVGRGPRARSWPTLIFVASLVILLLVGAVLALTGNLGQAPSAGVDVTPDPAYAEGLHGVLAAILVLRAFSSGSAAVTGIEAPISSVGELVKPQARTAGWVLVWLGVVSTVLTLGTLFLARATGVKMSDAPSAQFTEGGEPVVDYVQAPALAQLAEAVFGNPWVSAAFALIAVVMLLAAGMVGFISFPRLAYHLAMDGYLPRQLRTKGDRLGFSNGILVLGFAAIALVVASGAHLTALIQLYVIGVFVAFTLSQLGMVRHWRQRIVATADRRLRASMRRRRLLAFVGFLLSALVLLVVLSTKFLLGAWIAVAGIAVLSAGMISIRRHYDQVDEELAITPGTIVSALPARVHAIVLVSTLRKPVLRAISFARATRPQQVEAVMVDVEPQKTARTVAGWQELGLPLPLTVLASPYRETSGPLLDHIRRLRADRPRDLVVVYIPEYVVGRWWEQLAHNQTGLRLKARLHYEPGVVVASVPWQLSSTARPTHPMYDPAVQRPVLNGRRADEPAPSYPDAENPEHAQ